MGNEALDLVSKILFRFFMNQYSEWKEDVLEAYIYFPNINEMAGFQIWGIAIK